MIGIIDYGAGNLRSVKKAFDFLDSPSEILGFPDKLSGIERLVLPGVGSFGHAADRLAQSGWAQPLSEWIAADRPFLGICLGLQLLFQSSRESPESAGLAVFPGHCRLFSARKVPHMGWNTVHTTQDTPLFTGIKRGAFFYFVHSFFVSSCPQNHIQAVTSYNGDFISAAGRGRIYGVQFHPEKSGDQGLRLLQNWVERC